MIQESPILSSLMNRSTNAPLTRTKHDKGSTCIAPVLVAGLVGQRSQGEHLFERGLYLGIIRHRTATVALQVRFTGKAFSTTEFLIAIYPSVRLLASLYRCSFSPTRNAPPLAIT